MVLRNMVRHCVILTEADRTVPPKILAITKLMWNPSQDISVEGGQGLWLLGWETFGGQDGFPRVSKSYCGYD